VNKVSGFDCGEESQHGLIVKPDFQVKSMLL